jgi:hypothetical protein
VLRRVSFGVRSRLGDRVRPAAMLGLAGVLLWLLGTGASPGLANPGVGSAGSSPSGLAYSSASNHVVQTQPAPNSCRAIGSGSESRPDPRCTPGALNPHVTQASIRRTICRSGWTSRVRPAEAITEREKRASMAAYGDHRSLGHYEYDHFVPLELGGATNDARNLWPEPGGSPNPKDSVENYLNHKVCDGQMSLAKAQRAVVTNWVRLARAEKRHRGGSPKHKHRQGGSHPPGCYPKTDSGNCYEPGEYCREEDHGKSGIAGNGEPITCEDNNGWRWEPS